MFRSFVTWSRSARAETRMFPAGVETELASPFFARSHSEEPDVASDVAVKERLWEGSLNRVR
jgi:hypothetical protein